MTHLPVMRPKLPAAHLLLPYLSRIDRTRIYSNFGPLTAELEARLAVHLGSAERTVTTVANATLGLTLALSAQGVKPGTFCVMPAWTFIASAQAVTAAGLVPFFVDVDPATWALHPDAMSDAIAQAPGEVGAVMPVMPFGGPIDLEAWDAFRSRCGLPVVIDAAAGFDTLRPTVAPAVVSLHATKVFGIGEGGLIVSEDTALIRSIRTRSNFGFYGTREAAVSGMNAKLSEYHAAVGHAALDEWAAARSEWVAVARAYRTRLASRHSARFLQGFGESWVSSVCVLEPADHDVADIENRLRSAKVETRRWWSGGAHAHQSTRHCPRTALPVTERLARSTIAVPFSRDLTPGDIDRVVEACCPPAMDDYEVRARG
jgi:dTDP-4-amino-4,6-dideoxygalactose transaminase